MNSPGPDGLRIRQTRDATVIRVFPYASQLTRGVLGSLGLILVWMVVRALLPPSLLWASVVLLCVALGVVGVLGLRAVRRASQVLEIYVGKRHLNLVWSRQGRVVRKVDVPLVTVEDARRDPLGVMLLLQKGPPLFVPMAQHSDEARGWMVEHIRGAGLGARRRFGHLAIDS